MGCGRCLKVILLTPAPKMSAHVDGRQATPSRMLRRGGRTPLGKSGSIKNSESCMAAPRFELLLNCSICSKIPQTIFYTDWNIALQI